MEAPINVLIAEDFPAFRELLCSILERRPDCHVGWQAPDGLEAVERSEKLQPDLILLDIGLPRLNGIEAARRIRKVSPNSRILFVSCESSAEVVQEALSVGAHGYLLKSDAVELPLAVNVVLQGKQFLSSRLAKDNGFLLRCGSRSSRGD